MNTALVIMAAGMGSRFGGLKQIEPIGPNGEALIDFSVYDAAKAGFTKTIIIIKKEIEKDFRELCGKRLERLMDVDYAFQELYMLPEGYSVPAERKKPWGTGHAVLCAGDKISMPFAVINADDYYGRSAYEAVHKHLIESDEMCMAGYKLGNTLTENGTVSRGVCEVENGYLKSIVEHTALDRNSGLPLDTVVSMNLWGFMPDFIPYLEKEFAVFLEKHINEPKSEFFLPSVVSRRMAEEGRPVRVIETNEQWYGVTYREDTEMVKHAINKYIREGKYKL